MASRQWFEYVSDAGAKYAVNLSGKLKTVNILGFKPVSGTVPPRLPKGMRMRKVHAVSTSGTKGAGFKRRSFPVGTPEMPIYKTLASTAFKYSGTDFVVTGRTGECYTMPIAFDSGETE